MLFINELLADIIANAVEEAEAAFAVQTEATKAFIFRQTKIRMALYDSTNFGHQSCAAGIMRTLARWGYNQTIEVYCEGDIAPGASLYKKIKLLFPEFKGSNIPFFLGDEKDMAVTMKPMPARPLPEPVELAILGGYDREQEFAAMLNAVNLIVLQPFRWTRGDNKVVQEVIEGGTHRLISTDLTVQLGYPLSAAAFYLPVPGPVLSDDDREVLQANGYRRQVDVATYLIANLGTRNLGTVYGLKTLMPATTHLGMLNYVSGILEQQSPAGGGASRGAVVLSFDTWGEGLWDSLQTWVTTGQPASAGADTPNQVFTDWYTLRDVKHRVVLLPVAADVTVDAVTRVLATLTATQVLVINMGGVPQVLFNYLYAQATLPTVLEGQSTTNLVLNLGRPYLKLTSGIGGEQLMASYPALPISSAQALPPAWLLVQLTNNAIRTLPASWVNTPGSVVGNPPRAGLALLTRCYAPPEPGSLAQYFQALGTQFNAERNDKLLLALNYFVNVLGPIPLAPPPPALLATRTADPSPLEQLYERLKGAVSAGVLDYFQAVGSGVISSFFASLCTKLGITVQELTLSADKTAITLTGTTPDFGVGPADVGFAFTYANDNYQAAFTADFPQATLALPGAPWLTVQRVGLRATLQNGGTLPASGALTCVVQAGKTLDLEIRFPSGEGSLLLAGTFAEGALTLADVFVFVGGVNLAAQLPPPPLAGAANIGLTGLELTYNPAAARVIDQAESFSLGLAYAAGQSWSLVPGLIEIQDLTANIMVTKPFQVAERSTEYTLSGKFGIADSAVSVTATLPNLAVYGGLDPDSPPLSLDKLLNHFLTLPSPVSANVEMLTFSYQGLPATYSLTCQVQTDWPIPATSPLFIVKNLGFEVQGEAAKKSGAFSGTILILPDSNPLELVASTSYATDEGWTFAARQTSGVVSLVQLCTGYLPAGWQPDPAKFDVKLNGLILTLKTQTSSWEFAVQTAESIPVYDTGITLEGSLVVGRHGGGKQVLGHPGRPVALPLAGTNADQAGYYGTLSAAMRWQGIALTLFYDFNPDYKSFGITWAGPNGNELTGKVIQQDGKTTATLTFGESTTVGSIIETMVSWATGYAFSLGAPWNVLDAIPLNNLELEYNFTDKQVKFKVNISPIELGFARIDSIGVSYQSNQPKAEDNGVMVEITGSFRWQSDPSQPLGWDAAKPETTPAPAGQGNKYFDLRLLALGQHVALSDLKEVTNVEKAIELMGTLPDPAADPPELPAVTLDPNSSWLIGLDFGVLRLEKEKSEDKKAFRALAGPNADGEYVLADEAADEEADEDDDEGGYFVTMQIVFNDPNLYALRLALDGAPAKIFKGLDFQILYKKVSDTVGVYMAEITLPDVMRQIKLGTVNITLPMFAIQVYTNGDFLVDIGFPWNQNFARSLTFQALIITPVGIPIPVMGSVGLYFGKLSSATTDRVPVSTRGTFNPVLVFGFGMQFGLGYSFEAGILKAGFSLTAIAILEGLLAKWNPYQLPAGPADNSQLETAYYFWFRGTVGIVGKLYGTVDFAIIKAELNIEFSLIAQLTFAAYAPILLSITASVDVGLTVTINLGFFKIHISFSFSARISQSVTIHAIGGTAPWADGSPQGLLGQPLRTRHRPMLLAARGLAASAPTPQWGNLRKADTVAPLKGYLGLGLTMAGDAAQTPAEQVACYVSMLFIESVKPPQADCLLAASRALENKALADTDSSFEQLCKMLFRWVVAAIQPGPLSAAEVDECVVTDAQLKQVLEYLSDRTNPTPLGYADLAQFLANQFTLTVSTGQQAGSLDATYFPMPDELSFSLPAYGGAPALAYRYGQYNALATDYVSQLARYFDELAVVQQQEAAPAARLTAAPENAALSMSSFVFSDYFLLLCRQMVQAGRDALRDFKYPLQVADTPAIIVAWAQHNGQPGYSVAELFADNATVALNSAAGQLVVDGSYYLVQGPDTLASIAGQALYAQGFSAQALALTNQHTANLLRPGSTITYPALPNYQVLPGQSLADVAAKVGPTGVPIDDLLAKGNVLALDNLLLPAVPLAVPPFGYAIAAADTLRGIASRFGITTAQLAAPAANAALVQLFDPTVLTIDLVELGEFKVGAVLREIQATQGLQHLSGMTSRYYMAGLRLPTAGITPHYPGMWVQAAGAALSLPPYAGLYALTGQQFALPAIAAGLPLNITFGSAAGWLQFAGSTPQQAVVAVVAGTPDAERIASVRAFATRQPLEVGTTRLGAAPAFRSKPATFPFTSAIVWSSAGPVAMPYDGAPAGLPALKLWQLPDALLQLPGTTRALNPRVKPQVGYYNSATGAMDNTVVQHYGYATVVEFTIKKIPVVPLSPATQTTYEIAGADGTNADLLEKIVAGVGSDDSKIASLSIAYSVGANAATPPGIQTDDQQFLTVGVAQVNLSTDTHPSQLFLARQVEAEAAAPGFRLLNKPTGLLSLLWEASITHTGGFYLYYYNAESSAGLPDSIFDSNQEATVRLVVLYANPGAAVPEQQNRVANYMNALATAEALDTSSAVLFAEADPLPVRLPMAAGQQWTLTGLAEAYFDNVADLATNNQGHALRAGAVLAITEGTYQVGPAGPGPGGDLAAIATHFATTPADIKAANPLRQDWPAPLPLFTALRLPTLQVTVGQSSGGTTLAELATYYGQNLTALAAYNQDVVGVFADDTAAASVLLAGGPMVRSAIVPAGVAALEAVRPVPPLVPDDPTDANFGNYFLQNNFSLLGYQLLENEAFRAGPVGLPAGPTSVPEAAAGNDKIRQPRVQLMGESWVYRQSIPYSRFATQKRLAAAGLPPLAESPYQGLGNLLKVDFAWRDYYGNQLITTLSQPAAAATVLNQPPVLTGYTDALLGLSQWPSVSANWQVNPAGPTPELQVLLSFDDSPYQGLYQVAAVDARTVVARFTQKLDPTAAGVTGNYTLVQLAGATGEPVAIASATLSPDGLTVTLAVGPHAQDENRPLRLTIGNLASADKKRTFSGVANFVYATESKPYTSPVTDSAERDRLVYRQLWYQLRDANGIRFSLGTELLQNRFVLTDAQVADLLDGWLASVYLFLADRAHAQTTVAAPAAQHPLTFPIDLAQLNPAQIFRLELSFRIERTGGAVAGDFETTGGVKQVSTALVPASAKGPTDNTYSFAAFARQFELALQVPGHYALRVASGLDRTAPDRSTSSQALWAVRQAASPGIAYQVTNPGSPDLFAPAPISNQLQSRAQVPIFCFDAKTGIDFDKPSRYLDFAGIDMDQWGKAFFTAIDHVLSPEYTAAIQLVDFRQQTTFYADILQCKAELADVVKNWLIPLFRDAGNSGTAAVREAFRQLLLVQLGNAYSTSAAAQFAASVSAEVPVGTAPRLYGAVNANFRFLGATLDPDTPTQVVLFFNSALDPDRAANPANYTLTPALEVQQARPAADNPRKVTLTLSTTPAVGTTQVTVSATFTDAGGNALMAPLSQPVTTGIDAGNYSSTVALTSAKLSLQPGTEQPLVFLMTSPQVVKDVDGAILPYLDLDLTYAGTQIEHQIEQLTAASDYEASSWLSFLTGDGAQAFVADLGKFRVPLVLRSFPTMPVLVSQLGKASHSPTANDTGDFGQLLNWDYFITYSEPLHFPQDKLTFTVNFNVKPDPNVKLLAMKDAFDPLAEFITVYPDVEQALTATLARIDATTTDAQAFADSAVALKSFNDLVGRVIAAASGLEGALLASPPAPRLSNAAEPYVFDVQEGKAIIRGVDALVVRLNPAVPAGMAPPTVSLEGPGYITRPYDQGGEPNPAAYAYYFEEQESGIPVSAAVGQQQPQRIITLSGLNVLNRQDAETLVELKRNVELIPGWPSADAFVYRTGQIGFADKLHPTIIQAEPIDISTLLASPAEPHNTVPLAQHLANLLEALLAQNSQPVLYFQLSTGYEYPLGTGLSNIALPVMMQPLTLVQVLAGPAGPSADTTRAQLIADWAAALLSWFRNYQPSAQGAAFTFDLTLFSNLTEQPLPLLRLTSLGLPVQYISNLSGGDGTPAATNPTVEQNPL